MKLSDQSRKTPPLQRSAALNLTPLKNSRIEQERLPSGEILIRYPAPVRPPFTALLGLLGRTSGRYRLKKLQLDGLGSEVWDLIDGQRTVRQIVQQFAEKHRLATREAETAVAQFLRSLGRRGLIGLG